MDLSSSDLVLSEVSLPEASDLSSEGASLCNGSEASSARLSIKFDSLLSGPITDALTDSSVVPRGISDSGSSEDSKVVDSVDSGVMIELP